MHVLHYITAALFSFPRLASPLVALVLQGITVQLAQSNSGKCPAQWGHGMSRKEAGMPAGACLAHRGFSAAVQAVFPQQVHVLQVREDKGGFLRGTLDASLLTT